MEIRQALKDFEAAPEGLVRLPFAQQRPQIERPFCKRHQSRPLDRVQESLDIADPVVAGKQFDLIPIERCKAEDSPCAFLFRRALHFGWILVGAVVRLEGERVVDQRSVGQSLQASSRLVMTM
ncbi:MAG: hypothetical protein ACK4P4_14605 [Allorhizobium sp.]